MLCIVLRPYRAERVRTQLTSEEEKKAGTVVLSISISVDFPRA
jgi:hypothetical protein